MRIPLPPSITKGYKSNFQFVSLSGEVWTLHGWKTLTIRIFSSDIFCWKGFDIELEDAAKSCDWSIHYCNFITVSQLLNSPIILTLYILPRYVFPILGSRGSGRWPNDGNSWNISQSLNMIFTKLVNSVIHDGN